ncbi:hypothetical protein C8F04DRAFT_1198694 [Mycena alexandri]|uniref:Uncharacterized protein n=1 Tax=Mycena alexandri TaxID=1745969 RepID=A0AAD6WRV3_9AGAR|nr:hypothetical protein C8F04DRAFT_1198694 [Mycena alexandri]
MTPKYVAELKKKPKPSAPEAFMRKLVPTPTQQYGRQLAVPCRYKREHELRVNMGAHSDDHLGDWAEGCHPSKDDDNKKCCAPKFPPSSSPITPEDRIQWRAALEHYKPREAKLKSLLYYLKGSVQALVDIQSLKAGTALMPSATVAKLNDQLTSVRTLMNQLDANDVPIWTINSVPKRNNKAHTSSDPISESDSDSDESDAPVVVKGVKGKGKAPARPNNRGSQPKRTPARKANNPIPDSDSNSNDSDAPVVRKGKGKAPAKRNSKFLNDSQFVSGRQMNPRGTPCLPLRNQAWTLLFIRFALTGKSSFLRTITVFSLHDSLALKTNIHVPKETYMNLADYPLNLEYPVTEYMLFSPRSGGYNSVEGPVNLVGRGHILVYRHSSLTVEDCRGIDALEEEARRQAHAQEDSQSMPSSSHSPRRSTRGHVNAEASTSQKRLGPELHSDRVKKTRRA